MSLRIIASFWLLLWCSFLLPLSASQVDAHEKNKTPCQIDVIFEDDQAGVATYFVLRLQHKNQSRRVIEAVSVLVRDSTDKLIRNSDAICGDGNEGIDAGDTGECSGHGCKDFAKRYRIGSAATAASEAAPPPSCKFRQNRPTQRSATR